MERYLRSCDKECLQPVSGKVTGTFPQWLNGSLLRNGPGLMHVGPDSFNHLFDGLALVHKFNVQDGHTTYQNAFVKGNNYLSNIKANRIVATEFGTRGHPDPCLSIFGRFMHRFEKYTNDNTLVNIFPYGDGVYAATEGKILNKIDPETLETTGNVKLSDHIAVNHATAHPHFDEDGTMFNLGNKFTSTSAYYNIMSFPPGGDFSKGKVLSTIPARFFLWPSYNHSFGMSANFFILAEQSLMISMPTMVKLALMGEKFSEGVVWYPDEKTRFRIVRRSDGAEVTDIKYFSDAFMIFHHINSYEEDGHLIVDMCCYKNGDVMKNLYMKSIEDQTTEPLLENSARRYVLPLSIPKSAKAGENIVTLPYVKAKAILQDDGTLLCEYENLIKQGPTASMELPRINYEKYNTKKYRYFYSWGLQGENSTGYSLIKVDVTDGSLKSWSEPESYPAEPVFIPSPESVEEDDGIILSSVLHKHDQKKVTLVALDARSFEEIARAEFFSPGVITPDFHGSFISS